MKILYDGFLSDPYYIINFLLLWLDHYNNHANMLLFLLSKETENKNLN